MFKEDAESKKFLEEKKSLWENTEKLSDYVGKADQFDAIFYVGGHGRTSSCKPRAPIDGY
jgi:putative intracellular protease/amidase